MRNNRNTTNYSFLMASLTTNLMLTLFYIVDHYIPDNNVKYMAVGAEFSASLLAGLGIFKHMQAVFRDTQPDDVEMQELTLR